MYVYLNGIPYLGVTGVQSGHSAATPSVWPSLRDAYKIP